MDLYEIKQIVDATEQKIVQKIISRSSSNEEALFRLIFSDDYLKILQAQIKLDDVTMDNENK